MRRRLDRVALGAALLVLLSLLLVAGASGFDESAIPISKGEADDCAAVTSIVPGAKDSVEYVVYCGPNKGRMMLSLAPDKRSAPVRWGAPPRVAGPGATGAPRCARNGARELCRLRKSGPVTIRGRFRVAAGACASQVTVQIPSTNGFLSGDGFAGKPRGCAGRKPPATPTVASIVHFYFKEELEPALSGGRAAMLRVARRLRRAWIAGSPVERWSAVGWGAPIDAPAAEELALRSRAREQAAFAIPAWIHEHKLGSIYAGWYGAEGNMYVGFTREPAAMLARMKADVPFVAPGLLKLFPTAPLYSEWHLTKVMNEVLGATEEIDEDTYGVTDIGVEIETNKVGVGAIHVAATRRLLTERLGAEAPIEVVKGGSVILH